VGIPHHVRFLQTYLKQPGVVGAVSPSSKALAAALAEPYRLHRDGRASILEVGAGTGAITRYIGTILRPGDEFDICEVQPDFANILEKDVLSRPAFRTHVAAGAVRLLRSSVQELPFEKKYDYIISGLPFTVFAYAEVCAIFDVLRRCLKPDGVFSYFEYVAMRKATRMLSLGRNRNRIRAVSSFLSRNIKAHQFAQRIVLLNFPPAHARHLRFNGAPAVAS
jgi:phospholipid N-methyltransferase